MELQRNILESSNIKLRSLLCLHIEDTSKVLFWLLVYCSMSLTLDSMSLLGQTFVPELWYDLSTNAPKGKTEYNIKTRCLIFLMSGSVTRFYSTINTNSYWPAAWKVRQYMDG
jgi:hypothetical protein